MDVLLKKGAFMRADKVIMSLMIMAIALPGGVASGQQKKKLEMKVIVPPWLQRAREVLTSTQLLVTPELIGQIVERERQECESQGGCYYDCSFGDKDIGCRDSYGAYIGGRCIRNRNQIAVSYRSPVRCPYVASVNQQNQYDRGEDVDYPCWANVLQCDNGRFSLVGNELDERNYSTSGCQFRGVVVLEEPLQPITPRIVETHCKRECQEGHGCWLEIGGENICFPPKSTWELSLNWVRERYLDFYDSQCLSRGASHCTAACAYACIPPDQNGITFRHGEGDCKDLCVEIDYGQQNGVPVRRRICEFTDISHEE